MIYLKKPPLLVGELATNKEVGLGSESPTKDRRVEVGLGSESPTKNIRVWFAVDMPTAEPTKFTLSLLINNL
jgi:hypothetical protein